MTRPRWSTIPYKGDAPAIIDLIGGQIQLYFGGPLVLSPATSTRQVARACRHHRASARA